MARIIIGFSLSFTLLLFIIWFVLTQPLVFSSAQVNTPKANPQTLKSHVEMLSQTLPSRIDREEALEPTVKWIESQLQKYGSPKRQTYQVNGESFHNIILSFGPETQDMVVVGAHYDTADGLPGADDNASGVAGLIELARLLSQAKLSLRVELVAYTLEEPPHYNGSIMGSYIHAESMKKAGKDIRLMMSLEMIGYFSDEANSQHYPVPLLNLIYPSKGNFIAVVANLNNIAIARKVKKSFRQSSDLPVYSINAPALIPGIDFSDHKNYWLMGFPAVMITDTAFARNMAYHTIHDTADRLDYDKMAKVVEATYHTVLQQSQGSK
jgi:Zn-dependent M28 family amino/carboxypeptidase